jgi:hypothetical protein
MKTANPKSLALAAVRKHLEVHGNFDRYPGNVTLHGLARLLKCFTGQIRVYSEHASSEFLEEQGNQKASLSEIFSGCEVVVLAGGYTPKTHHMIRKAHFPNHITTDHPNDDVT